MKNPSQVSCEECDFRPTTKETLSDHMKTHVQSIKKNLIDDSKKVMHCYQCKFTLTDEAALQLHIKQKHRIQCDNCEEHFENEEFMRNHRISNHHILCDICQQHFENEDLLRNHKNDNHIISCEKCNKQF